MFHKIVFVLMCLAAAKSAAIDTHNPNYAPTSFSSINIAPKTPAPIYEENDTNKHRDTSKISFPFSNEKYSQISNNGAFLTQTYPTIYSSPIHHSVYYNPTSYSVATPVSGIYTQSHGIPVLTKTYSTPVLTKSPGLLAYSHAPVQDHALKTTITYSEAPLVSHMTFSGLGTNYAW